MRELSFSAPLRIEGVDILAAFGVCVCVCVCLCFCVCACVHVSVCMEREPTFWQAPVYTDGAALVG